MVCGILVSGPRIEPITPAEEVQNLKYWISRKVPEFYFWKTNTLKERLEERKKQYKGIPKKRLFQEKEIVSTKT